MAITKHQVKNGMKKCTQCGAIKPVSEFNKRYDAKGTNYRAACKECHLSAGYEWRRKNPEKARRYSQDWHNRNPRFSAWNTARYRADKLGILNDLTLEEWVEIYERFGGRCAYCLSAPAEDLEHVVPVIQGGGNTSSNVVPACSKCNNQKIHHQLVPHIASIFWPPSEDLLR